MGARNPKFLDIYFVEKILCCTLLSERKTRENPCSRKDGESKRHLENFKSGDFFSSPSLFEGKRRENKGRRKRREIC